LAVVAVVWGVIAWKVLSPPEPAAPPPVAARPAAAKGDVPDTLLLNYRDPFLGAGWAESIVNLPDPGLVMRPLPPAPVIKKAVRHNVRYVGRIRRQGTEYSLAEINGTLHTLRPGESADGYVLDSILPDSLIFTFDGETIGFELVP
jgi:hypothetical protein